MLLITPLLSADDLYKVVLQFNHDITKLQKIGAEPLIKLNQGYLIILRENFLDMLKQSQLEYELVKQNIQKEHLAIDNRLDDLNRNRYLFITQWCLALRDLSYNIKAFDMSY